MTIFLGVAMGNVFSQTQVRGDPSQLPEIDYSKQFNMKKFGTSAFSGADRTFSTKEIQSKTVQLPPYYGNLKPVPLTEWNSSRPDVYSKSLSLQGFQIKKAVDRWSTNVTLREDEPYHDNSPVKGDDIQTSDVETKESEPGKNVTGQKLRELINKGIKPEPVKTGRGFNAGYLGEEKAKEQPKTESPPK